MIEVKDFGIDGWAAQVSKEERARWYCERLEEGDEDCTFLVNVRQASAAYHKNISYRLKEDRGKGFARGSTDAERLRAILRRYSERVTQFAAELLSPLLLPHKSPVQILEALSGTPLTS